MNSVARASLKKRLLVVFLGLGIFSNANAAARFSCPAGSDNLLKEKKFEFLALSSQEIFRTYRDRAVDLTASDEEDQKQLAQKRNTDVSEPKKDRNIFDFQHELMTKRAYQFCLDREYVEMTAFRVQPREEDHFKKGKLIQIGMMQDKYYVEKLPKFPVDAIEDPESKKLAVKYYHDMYFPHIVFTHLCCAHPSTK